MNLSDLRVLVPSPKKDCSAVVTIARQTAPDMAFRVPAHHSTAVSRVNAFAAQSDFPVEHLSSPAFVPGVAWSDHLSFWRAGYRALMVTDTAFHRYPHYHLVSDTAERICYPEMTRVVTGLARAVAALAGAD